MSQDDPAYVYFSMSELPARSPAPAEARRPGPPGSRRRGEQGHALVERGSEYPEPGIINFADRAVDPNTGTFTLRASFPNKDRRLLTGQFARIRALYETRPNALLVPERAVTETLGQYSVVVIGAGEKAEARTVSPGPRVGRLWVIEKGLNAGDRIVVEGLQKALPGRTESVADHRSRGNRRSRARDRHRPVSASDHSWRAFSSIDPSSPPSSRCSWCLAARSRSAACRSRSIPRSHCRPVRVQTAYLGAVADIVEASVTSQIDTSINGVTDMLYIRGTSANDGTSSITVTLALERNPDLAANEVQARVSQAQPTLPVEVINAGVTVRKQSPDTLMFISGHSLNGTRNKAFLDNFATITLADRLKRVRGVGDVTVFGSDFGMRIWLRPDDMASLGLTVDDVAASIREQNVQVPAGQIGAPPVPSGQGFQYPVRVQGRLVTEEQFGNIIVKSLPSGRFVRIRDIADVQLGSKSYNYASQYNGRPATLLAIYLSPGANAVQCARLVRAELDSIRPTFPDDVRDFIMVDTSEFVNASIEEVIRTFFEALLLVLIVVMLFLQSWRATLIPMLAVPVSLLGDVHGLRRARLLGQHAVALRDGPCHRHRRRRRDRGRRGGRAQHRARPPVGAGSDAKGDGRSVGSRRRHRSRPRRRVPADGVHPGHHRSAVQAVRADGGGVGDVLGPRRADPHAGPVCAVAQAEETRGRARPDRRVLPRLQPRLRVGHRPLRPGRGTCWCDARSSLSA